MLLLPDKRQLLIQAALLCCVFSCELPFVTKGYYCVHVTEPKSFDDGCDARDFSDFDAELYGDVGVSVWLPVRRKYKFGPMVFETPGDQFYEEFEMEHYYRPTEHFIEKDCMVVLNYTVFYVDCNEKHPHLCFYAGVVNFCDVDTSNIGGCLCQVLESDSDYEDEDDCELNSEFSTTPGDLNYFKVPDPGAFSASYWQFGANCPTCRVTVLDIPKVDLVLNFETRTKRLFLNVYSPEGVFYDGHTQSIYCFTDAAEDIEKSVEIDFKIAVFSNTSRNREVYELELEDYIGNYWCMAFQLPTLSLVRSNKILAFKRKGAEFALMLHHNNSYSQYPCNADGLKLFVFPVLKQIFRGYVRKLRFMEIAQIELYNSSCQMDFIVHATRREQEDFSNYTQFLAELYYSGHVRITYIADAIHCNAVNATLSWPRASIGESVTSLEICVNEEDVPIRRLCGGNFTYGAQWLQPHGYCSNVSHLPLQTIRLHNITLQKMEKNLSKEVVRLSGAATQISSALDIEYFSNVLNKMFHLRQNSTDYLFDVAEVIDNVMKSDFDVLQQAQVLFNATDNILHICEALYEDTDILQNVTFFHMQRNNYFVQITKPFYSNVSGIAIYGDNSTNLQVSNFTDTTPQFTDNLIVATLLPNDAFHNNNTTDNLTIIITVFFQQNLFIDVNNPSNATTGNIVSIVAPHHGAYLRKPIKVWFGSKSAMVAGSCAFWDYGDMFHKKSGSWSGIGGSLVGRIDNGSVVECEYSHLTPFALLVLTERNEVDNVSYSTVFDGNVNHYVYLNVITLIGTVLSTTGIGIIFLTALLFPEWRFAVGTKILLQLSLVILLEVVLTQVADMHNVKDSVACTAIGIILHYIVCSKFCWMLVFAVLQYSRFVTILGTRPTHLPLKAAAIGWLLPALPVVIVICCSLSSYSAGTFMFCYPKGLALILGLLLPITLIAAFNVFAFIFIMYKVNSTTKQNEKRRQIVLAVLLFFMLGVPWLFGLLIELFEGTWLHYFCAYMFCITATLQGFVLFVFYILLNSEMRTKWKHFLCGKTVNERHFLI